MKKYIVGFWINMGEAITTIEVTGDITPVEGSNTSILINGALVDFGETIDYIKEV